MLFRSAVPAPDNAVINGIVNPNGLATDAWFEYGQDSTLSTYTKTADQPISPGTAPVSVQGTLTGLVPGTTYYYRVLANNAAGASSGTIETFSTALSPTAITSAASTFPDNAVIPGEVNPNGLETDAWFEYGQDRSFSTYTTTNHQAIGNGTTPVPISETLSGLIPGTTYYYRVAASNEEGTSRGAMENFILSQAPAAVSNPATIVAAQGATLNGSVDPKGQLTTCWFVWGTDPDLTNPSMTGTTSTQTLTQGLFSAQLVSASLLGLSPGVTYYFRAAAANTDGQDEGSILSFTTSASPAVSTDAATSITTSSATLNGTVNPNGYATDAWFEYGTDPSLTAWTETSHQGTGSGGTTVSLNAPISGLNPWRTYYFRTAASNSGGSQKGAIRSFPTGDYYVAVGDSITRGSHDDIPADDTSLDGRNTGGGYEPILNNLLTAAKGYPHTVVNEGVSGHSSADGAASISSTLSRNPSARYFVVMYGTNDAFDPAVPRDTYKANMQAIITAIKNAGKTPFLAKVPYTTEILEKDLAAIQDYNTAIDELVVENGISATPPDFYSYFQANQDRLADGTHPDGLGYQGMADRWLNALP